jgi:hypothetical protein
MITAVLEGQTKQKKKKRHVRDGVAVDTQGFVFRRVAGCVLTKPAGASDVYNSKHSRVFLGFFQRAKGG